MFSFRWVFVSEHVQVGQYCEGACSEFFSLPVVTDALFPPFYHFKCFLRVHDSLSVTRLNGSRFSIISLCFEGIGVLDCF